MFQLGIISFRESLEIVVITGIIALRAREMGKKDLIPYLILGAVAGILASGAAGFAAANLGAFIDPKLAEAIVSFAGVFVITWVIMWMSSGFPSARSLISRAGKLGMLSAGFLIVLREGLELALMSVPFLRQGMWQLAAGAAAGAAAGSAFLAAGMKFYKNFVLSTNILLIFIASGLLGYAVHEVIEFAESRGAGMGLFAAKVYDISDNPVLSTDSLIGGFLSIFGYSDSMEVGRLAFQLLYLLLFLPPALKPLIAKNKPANQA